MHETTKTVIVFLAFALFAAGCGSRFPTSPTAPTAATPSALPASQTAAGVFAAVVAQHWKLTRTLKSVTSPERCSEFSDEHLRVGNSSDWLMDVQLPGESIRLTVSDLHDPTEFWHYDGTVAAEEFSATVPVEDGALLCGGSRISFRDEDSLLGRFSEEGRMLTGEEVELYRFTSGEALSFRFDWSASRID